MVNDPKCKGKIMVKLIVFFLFISCTGTQVNSETSQTSSSAKGISALEHLRIAKEMLHQEQGHLMIQGKAFNREEKERYEVLIGVGKKLENVIKDLERVQP
jgi:hypothetical protein